MFLLSLLSRLPLGILYLISDLMFFGGYYIVRYRRDVVWTNLKNSFPEKSIAELRSIQKKFYRNLCDYAVESLKLVTMSEEEVLKRMKYVNIEIATDLIRQGKPILYLTSHQFNWEWALASTCLSANAEITYVYQKQSSEFFDNFSHAIRKRFGAHPVRRESVGREVLKRKGTQHALATLGDQFPGFHHDKRYWTQFLNQETAFFQGTDQLAIIGQYTVLMVVPRRLRRGYYEAEIFTISTPPYSKNEKIVVVDKYAKVLEAEIRKLPGGWLWSHKRWKRTKKEMGDE